LSQPASPSDGKLIDDEVRIHGMVKMSAWKAYFAPCGGWKFALTCIFSLLTAQMLAIYRDYYLASRLDMPDKSSSHTLAMYLLIGFVAALVSSSTFLFMYLRSLRASKSFHELLLMSIVYATPRFLETTPIGRIMTRFSKDMQIIDEDIIEILYYFLRATLAVGLTLLVISSAAPLFFVAGSIAMAIFVRVSWSFIVGARETRRLEATSNAPMLSLFSEIIPGGKTIRSFGMQQAYMIEMERRFMEYLSADMMMR
ncbi:Transporter of the ATP-binding cassette (ABC), partial [Coemansia erecta]